MHGKAITMCMCGQTPLNTAQCLEMTEITHST